MRRLPWVIPFVATVLLVLATVEIVFCAECSPECCEFAQTSSPHGAITHSGDACLCCAHILVISGPHLQQPVSTALPAPEFTIPSLLAVPERPLYHPPQA